MSAGEVVVSVVSAIFAMVLCLGFGWIAANEGWVRECNHVGARLYDGKVFDCKERK